MKKSSSEEDERPRKHISGFGLSAFRRSGAGRSSRLGSKRPRHLGSMKSQTEAVTRIPVVQQRGALKMCSSRRRILLRETAR